MLGLSGCETYHWMHAPPVTDEQLQSDHTYCKNQRQADAFTTYAANPQYLTPGAMPPVAEINRLEAGYRRCMEAHGYALRRVTVHGKTVEGEPLPEEIR